jgi:glycerate kinase
LGVARLARRLGVPVIAIGGVLDTNAEAGFQRAGFAAVTPLMSGAISVEESMSRASRLLTATTARVMRLVQLGASRRCS